MDDNTKIELAREVMNALIARSCKNGFNKNNKLIITLLNDEKEMDKFNFKVIDKIINIYAPIVKRGKI